MGSSNGARSGSLEARPLLALVPRPGVPKPQRGQYVHARRLGAAVVDRDAHGDVLGTVLGVLEEHVEVPVLVERAGVE